VAMTKLDDYDALLRFITESNVIEGIHRAPTDAKVRAYVAFLSLATPTVEDIEALVTALLAQYWLGSDPMPSPCARRQAWTSGSARIDHRGAGRTFPMRWRRSLPTRPPTSRLPARIERTLPTRGFTRSSMATDGPAACSGRGRSSAAGATRSRCHSSSAGTTTHSTRGVVRDRRARGISGTSDIARRAEHSAPVKRIDVSSADRTSGADFAEREETRLLAADGHRANASAAKEHRTRGDQIEPVPTLPSSTPAMDRSAVRAVLCCNLDQHTEVGSVAYADRLGVRWWADGAS
jgi:hypothetical protein